MENINRGNRGTHLEYKSVDQSSPYLNRFQAIANRMKEGKVDKNLIFEVSKDAEQKWSPYLKRAEEILQCISNSLGISRNYGRVISAEIVNRMQNQIFTKIIKGKLKKKNKLS